MTFRKKAKKIRQNILQMLFGKDLYVNAEQLKKLNQLFQYRTHKYAPENKYPEMLIDWYHEKTGKRLDLNNPRTFNEKIQWCKLYESTPLKTRCADKLMVRDYIEEKIGKEYLVPLLGVYSNFDEIDFGTFPDRFVIKANHGCKYNIIVKDKAKFKKEQAKHEVDSWMGMNYAFYSGFELQYRDIAPKIIVEQYLEDKAGSGNLTDYKFHCFNGEPKYVQVDIDRHVNHKRHFYDAEWELQPFVWTYPPYGGNLSPPKNLERLLQAASDLSKDFFYARVDFYSTETKEYFGEMTFSPASGLGRLKPKEWDLRLGNLIKLPTEKE